MRRFSKFSEMTDVINVETVDRLRKVYGHVDDIDLFTGGLAERPVTGGVVGPTFACIIGQQFLNLRKGDRFWYENGNHPGAFTPEQLQQIRKASLSRIICDNLDDIESLQPFAFLTVDGFNNQRKACKGTGIPFVNLRAWHEGDLKPQQLNAALPGFYSINEPDLPDFSANDLEFEEYLKTKIFAEQEALAPNIAEGLDELPKPLSKENYLHVFDNEPDPLLANESNDLEQAKGRASLDHTRMLDDLFHSAREEAFENQELFY